MEFLNGECENLIETVIMLFFEDFANKTKSKNDLFQFLESFIYVFLDNFC